MQPLFLIRMLMLPGLLMRRGPAAYYGGSLAIQAGGLFAAAVWLIAPWAIWNTYGHWWMLLWLIPTTAAIFASAMVPLPGGG